ncbi:protein of unknown function [Ralstonia solanacearum CFBP2957]|nr:protein of unknown function [Ralstonia solanacearum CFBP2957]
MSRIGAPSAVFQRLYPPANLKDPAQVHMRQRHQRADAISTEPVAVSMAPACEHQR